MKFKLTCASEYLSDWVKLLNQKGYLINKLENDQYEIEIDDLTKLTNLITVIKSQRYDWGIIISEHTKPNKEYEICIYDDWVE